MINVALILLGCAYGLRSEHVQDIIHTAIGPSGTAVTSEDNLNLSFVHVQNNIILCTTSSQPEDDDQDYMYLFAADEAEFWTYHRMAEYYTQAAFYGGIDVAERMGTKKPVGAPRCVSVPFSAADSLPSMICDTCLSVTFDETYLSTCSAAQTLTQFMEAERTVRAQTGLESGCKVGSMLGFSRRVDTCIRARESVPEFDVSDARQHCKYEGDFTNENGGDCLYDIFTLECALGRAVLLSDGHCYAKNSIMKYRGSESPITKEAWSGSTRNFWRRDHNKCSFKSNGNILEQVKEIDEKVQALLEQKRVVQATQAALQGILTSATQLDPESDMVVD